MLQVISIIAMILSIVGQLLISYKKVSAFPIWILSNVCWIVVNIIGPTNIPQLITFIVFTLASAFGWYKWKK